MKVRLPALWEVGGCFVDALGISSTCKLESSGGHRRAHGPASLQAAFVSWACGPSELSLSPLHALPASPLLVREARYHMGMEEATWKRANLPPPIYVAVSTSDVKFPSVMVIYFCGDLGEL